MEVLICSQLALHDPPAWFAGGFIFSLVCRLLLLHALPRRNIFTPHPCSSCRCSLFLFSACFRHHCSSSLRGLTHSRKTDSGGVVPGLHQPNKPLAGACVSLRSNCPTTHSCRSCHIPRLLDPCMPQIEYSTHLRVWILCRAVVTLALLETSFSPHTQPWRLRMVLPVLICCPTFSKTPSITRINRYALYIGPLRSRWCVADLR